MKVMILGAGNIGRAIAHDLSGDFQVTIFGVDEEDLKGAERYGETEVLDVKNYDKMTDFMESFDLIVETLPGKLGYKAIEGAIEAGKDIVSVSFTPEDPLKLAGKAKDAGITVIPDAGFGPGLSNICIGEMDRFFDEFEEGIIYITGLPKNPRPPLNYRITWSPEGLIDEYKREARIIKDNRLEQTDPFEEIRQVKIKDCNFEGFLSDGLRTLIETVDVRNLEEWTLRWKGHLKKMKTLKELGFFEEENLHNTMEVITPLMDYESKDFSLMKVVGRGEIGGEKKEIEYFLYDEEKEFTSMARVTGFTAAITARLAAQKSFESGVIPPECIGAGDVKKVFSGLRDRDITLEKIETDI